MMNWLKKVNAINTTGLVNRTNFNTGIKIIKDKIPKITDLAFHANLNAKISEVKNEILNINRLATTYVLTAVKNQISEFSTLIKKADNNTKIVKIIKKLDQDHCNKYTTNREFNRLKSESFEA